MRHYIKYILPLVLLLPSVCLSASYNCANAKPGVEKKICGNDELSDLDDQLGALYRQARASSHDDKRLKSEQQLWLEMRNKCRTTACLSAAYEGRIKELSQSMEIHFDPKVWVNARMRKIKEILADKQLYIPEGVPSNTLFCHKLLEDVKTLAGIKIIAPEVITSSLAVPQVKTRITDRCLKFYNRWGKEYPRKVVLYHVDIDNDPANGKEWMLGDHYVSQVSPFWGDELLVRNEYAVLNVKSCSKYGVASVGGSRRYSTDTNVESLSLDTGIHGVLHYKGKYYIYDVSDEPKVDPFGIQKYNGEVRDSKSVCYFKERRNQISITKFNRE